MSRLLSKSLAEINVRQQLDGQRSESAPIVSFTEYRIKFFDMTYEKVFRPLIEY